VLHKYQGRALLIVTERLRGALPLLLPPGISLRRNPRKPGCMASGAGLSGGDASIREVILSGGDPLALSNRRWATLLAELDRIPHLQSACGFIADCPWCCPNE
jgi:hypothetical protein